MRVAHIVAACALALSLPTAALAQATGFVPRGAGFAWWTSELSFLPLGRADGGISVEDVDGWINANRGMRTESRTCFMSFVRDDGIVAPDRETHDEIRSKLAENPGSFATWFEPAKGHRFLARVGVFEECADENAAGEPLRYMAVVVTDEDGKVRDFDALDWNFLRLQLNDQGRLAVFGCYHCGEVRELAWDQGNDRFYYNWVGH